jgi:tRNA pseudouridine65 synthase
MELTLLYKDEQLVAVNKPAGLLVHRSNIDRHETRFALQLLRDQLGRHVYPVHRLDKPTSGVLLFALSPAIAAQLTLCFASRQVAKTYLAVVRGVPEEAGIIDHPLAEEPDRLPHGQPQTAYEPQEAVTEYRRLATVELPFAVGRYPASRYSLLAVTPQTGRRHQLRRHLKHLLHPVIGDTNYGEGRHNRLFRDEFHCHRLLLHAAEISFPHPTTGVMLTISSPLDESFDLLLDRLGWRHAIPPAWLP